MSSTNGSRWRSGGRRPGAWAVAFLLLALPSCGGIGGGGSAPPVPYEEIRGNLDRAYTDLNGAIEGGTFDRVPTLCTALGAELDRAEEAAKRWGILEREKMNLALATARHGLQDVSRTAPASGDPELLRAQLRPVGEAVQQAEALLDQAAEATKPQS
jgi:hypothetical protein